MPKPARSACQTAGVPSAIKMFSIRSSVDDGLAYSADLIPHSNALERSPLLCWLPELRATPPYRQAIEMQRFKSARSAFFYGVLLLENSSVTSVLSSGQGTASLRWRF